MADGQVVVRPHGVWSEIRLCRAPKRNALNMAMLAGLEAALAEVEQSEAGVALLTAEGEVFCAGGDIGAWAGLPRREFAYNWVRYGHRVFDRLAQLRQPTIAVLSGDAFGGGLELAAACDFRVIEAPARLAMPETSLGMVPGWSGTQRLARRFGVQVVRRMVLGGAVFDAAAAVAAGLADELAARGGGRERAERMAQRIAERGAEAVQLAKLLLAGAEMEAAAGAVEAIAGAAAAGGAELREGVAAFMEKRAPKFGRLEQAGQRTEDAGGD